MQSVLRSRAGRGGAGLRSSVRSTSVQTPPRGRPCPSSEEREAVRGKVREGDYPRPPRPGALSRSRPSGARTALRVTPVPSRSPRRDRKASPRAPGSRGTRQARRHDASLRRDVGARPRLQRLHDLLFPDIFHQDGDLDLPDDYAPTLPAALLLARFSQEPASAAKRCQALPSATKCQPVCSSRPAGVAVAQSPRPQLCTALLVLLLHGLVLRRWSWRVAREREPSSGIQS